jgi:hypothetical protein
MWLTIICFLIIALCIAMNLNEGLWGNALTLFNTIFAAMIATNLFEPAANFISDTFPSITYFADFLALWAVFCLALGIFDLATSFISRTRVRFKLPVEQAGRLISGALIGWVIVCFFLFSLHTAPTVRNSFGKAFGKEPMGTHFFVSPDRLWLGFMQSRSENALATSPPNVFDENSEFILKYGQRRKNFEEVPGLKVK